MLKKISIYMSESYLNTDNFPPYMQSHELSTEIKVTHFQQSSFT